MGSYNIYGYDPNEPMAYITMVVFIILFLIVTGMNIKYKTWWFMVIPIGSFMEFISFGFRPDSAYTVNKYVISTLGILLAPTVFAMADYSMLSKL